MDTAPLNPNLKPPVRKAGKGELAWRAAVYLFLGLALAVGLWLAVQRVPVGCGYGSGCRQVLTSRWAYWFEVPVSWLAVGAYLLLGGALGVQKRARTETAVRWSWIVVSALSVAILLVAGWFILIQMTQFQMVCRYCMAAHVFGGLAALLVLIRTPIAWRPERVGTSHPECGVWLSLRVVVGLGCALSAVLILGQTLGTGEHAQTGPVLSPYHFDVAGDQVTVKAYPEPFHTTNWPCLGDPHGRTIALFFASYTCPHCRATHKLLEEILPALGPGVRILIMPVPLEDACNPRVPKTQPMHRHGCEMAKLALALNLVSREAFLKYDLWLAGQTEMPAIEVIREHAKSLVDPAALDKALQSPLIKDYLSQSVTVYAQGPGPELPQIAGPEQIAMGEFPGKTELQSFLQEQAATR